MGDGGALVEDDASGSGVEDGVARTPYTVRFSSVKTTGGRLEVLEAAHSTACTREPSLMHSSIVDIAHERSVWRLTEARTSDRLRGSGLDLEVLLG